jgi:hypothetical protein
MGLRLDFDGTAVGLSAIGPAALLANICYRRVGTVVRFLSRHNTTAADVALSTLSSQVRSSTTLACSNSL